MATEKKWLFGTNKLTPGKNFINALTDNKCKDAPIGVPPYNYDKLYEIFDAVLTKEETELLLKGFGFDRPSMLQKEIAGEMNLTPNQVSVMGHKVIEKLQRTPYKVQIMKLAPTLEELSRLAELGLRYEAEEKKESELYFKYQAAKKSEERLSAKLKNREIQLAKADYEQKNLQKKVSNAKAENESQKKIILDLENKLAQEKAIVKVARSKYREMEDKIFGTLTSPDDTSAADELELTAEVKESLNRVGIKDIKTLCGLSSSSLSKMGIGQKGISEIKTALKNRGLSLRR